MSNALLLFCKEAYKKSDQTIAAALNVTPEQYKEMENGELLLSFKQAEALGKLYKTHGSYIYTSALQLDTLLAQRQIIKILKHENDQLKSKVKRKSRPAPGKDKKTRKANHPH